jgi:hypothetical protein
MDINKVSLFAGFLMALFIVSCKGDRTSQNAVFINPLANPQDGPPAGNPADAGTIGGGSGGAIYNDGNTMTLKILGTLIEKNKVNAYGSAVFFVTNDHTGDIRIDNSVIRNNTGGSWYPSYPGISMHSDTKCVVTNSIIE